MSQTTEIQIQNQNGLSFRTKLNQMLSALNTTFSGSTAPTTTEADMLWMDTSVTPNVLRRRNSANTAWDIHPVIEGNTHAATAKTTLADNDELAVADSAASFALKKISFANLKNQINELISNVPVRQTVLRGPVGSDGLPNLVSSGSGLACNFTAPATFAFANGFSASGSVDYVEQILSNQTGYWSSLSANNKTYLSVTRTGAGALTATKTLAPPQYGPSYDKSKQALLHFDGSVGATTFLDDYGGTWTAQGGAKLQSNWTKFGTTALGGAGASNSLNGTTDFVINTGLTGLGPNSWYVRCRVRFTSLAAAFSSVYSAYGAGGTGMALAVSSAGKTALSLASSSAAWDIANASLGLATLTVNTDYLIEVTFDSVAGKYYVYVDGVLDNTVTSSTRVQYCHTMRIGSSFLGPYYTTGYIDEFEFQQYCDHPNGTTYTVPTAASSVSTAGYSSDWFDTVGYTMYSVSGPSTSAGANPAFTSVNRLYVGEAITSGAAVTSALGYAYSGFIERLVTTNPSVASTFGANHQIGTTFGLNGRWQLINITPEYGYRPGDKVDIMYGSPGANGEGALASFDSNTSHLQFAGTTLPKVPNRSSGTIQTITAANWYVVMTAYRYW